MRLIKNHPNPNTILDYIKFNFFCDAETAEILPAYLAAMPFDTFEDNELGFDAYLPQADFSDDIIGQLEDLKVDYDFTYRQEFLEGQNWNAVWESNFPPVRVGNFCAVRATFHEPITDVKHEIVIAPKMAFGTGHHATTRQMMASMEAIDFNNAVVFDFGTGTGILAILAAQLGAKNIDATDVDSWSIDNTQENAALNNITNIDVRQQNDFKGLAGNYDVILANINKNVITANFADMLALRKPSAPILLSGLLATDRPDMINLFEAHKVSLISESQEGDWIQLTIR